MRRKRQLTTFGLSFLDIMCCGFGAVVLVFLIIDHAAQVQSQEVNKDLQAEVNFLEEDISEGKAGLVRLRNTLSMIDQQLVDANGLAAQIRQQHQHYQNRLEKLSNTANQERNQINVLTDEITQLEKTLQQLRKEQRTGVNARRFLGDGDRQYLTGLKLGGERVLILLDSSASMLDASIVNIIRLRNMSNTIKRNTDKWQQAVGTVQWLLAQLPAQGQYQIYHFNSNVNAVLPATLNKWLEVSNKAELEDAVNAVKQIIPEGGTSLEKVFLSVLDLSPLPDNVFLLTDGLPTQGAGHKKAHKVSGKQRIKLFEQAIAQLPASIPFNIILAPLEGDPLAAAAFWQLAQLTKGAFLSPSQDWP